MLTVSWSITLTVLLCLYIHPVLFIVWLIEVVHIFKDDRSCDSDDGSGGRARSGSYISQTSRVESEESTDDQYNGKSGEGSNDNDSHEQVTYIWFYVD